MTVISGSTTSCGCCLRARASWVGAGRHEWLVDVCWVAAERTRDVRESVCDDFLTNQVRARCQVGVVGYLHSTGRIQSRR